MNLPAVRLEFRDPPRHNKFYELLVEESYNLNTGQKGYVVTFRYGRIGRPPLVGTKTPKPVTYHTAVATFENYKREKLREGYEEVSGAVERDKKVQKLIQTNVDSEDDRPKKPKRNLIV